MKFCHFCDTMLSEIGQEQEEKFMILLIYGTESYLLKLTVELVTTRSWEELEGENRERLVVVLSYSKEK